MSDTLNKCLYKWSRRPVGSCHVGPAAIPVSEKRHVCVSLPHGKSTPRVLQLNLHKAATLGYRQLAPLWRYWLANRGSTKINMIFITLFWNELATGTALLVSNFLKKLLKSKVMSENIQTFENIVVWPHLLSPGATMSPINVEWLACNHNSNHLANEKRVMCVGGRWGRGARLRFIVRSKPRPSGQRKIFPNSPLLSQATDQCFLSPPLPHGLEQGLVPAKPWFTVLEWFYS